MNRRHLLIPIGLGLIHLLFAYIVAYSFERDKSNPGSFDIGLVWRMAVPVGVSLAQGATIGAIAIVGKGPTALKIFVVACVVAINAYVSGTVTTVSDQLSIGYVTQPILCGVAFAILHLTGLRVTKRAVHDHPTQYTLQSLGIWIAAMAVVLALTWQTPAIRATIGRAWITTNQSGSSFTEAMLFAILAVVFLGAGFATKWSMLVRLSLVIIALSTCAAIKWRLGHFVNSLSVYYNLGLYLIYTVLTLAWFAVLRRMAYEMTFVPIWKPMRSNETGSGVH